MNYYELLIMVMVLDFICVVEIKAIKGQIA
jgi:hypothetical protein